MERRSFLFTGIVGAGLLLGRSACAAERGARVAANEDLMREHGIIRRVMLVFREAARRARTTPDSIPLASLGEAAQLMREFGQDYHERLEEIYIFPVVRKTRGGAARLPDTLTIQHRRGAEITEYVRRVCKRADPGLPEAKDLAAALDAFVVMYSAHAAREDTEVLPAWRSVLGRKAYAEMGERFKHVERRMFGHDGFTEALHRVERIEASFGLADLAAATAPAPPAVVAFGR